MTRPREAENPETDHHGDDLVHLVYFSSASENTSRFIAKVGLPAKRIPLRRNDPEIEVTDPYVLVVPTYGGGNVGGAVPRQVVRFLNDPHNRSLLRGVVSAGNTNFGAAYCIAGDIIARKCDVPHLFRFELMGTAEDVQDVRERLETLWPRH